MKVDIMVPRIDKSPKLNGPAFTILYSVVCRQIIQNLIPFSTYPRVYTDVIEIDLENLKWARVISRTDSRQVEWIKSVFGPHTCIIGCCCCIVLFQNQEQDAAYGAPCIGMCIVTRFRIDST